MAGDEKGYAEARDALVHMPSVPDHCIVSEKNTCAAAVYFLERDHGWRPTWIDQDDYFDCVDRKDANHDLACDNPEAVRTPVVSPPEFATTFLTPKEAIRNPGKVPSRCRGRDRVNLCVFTATIFGGLPSAKKWIGEWELKERAICVDGDTGEVRSDCKGPGTVPAVLGAH